MDTEVGLFLNAFDVGEVLFPVCKTCGSDIYEGGVSDGNCSYCQEKKRSNIIRASYLKALKAKGQNSSCW